MRQGFAKKKEEYGEDHTEQKKLQFGGAFLGTGHAPMRHGLSAGCISFVTGLTEDIILGGSHHRSHPHQLLLLALPLLDLSGKISHLSLHLLLFLPDLQFPLANLLELTTQPGVIEIQ